MLETPHELLIRQRDRALPESPESMAIGYTLNNWAALCRCIEDGELAVDSNADGRSLRGGVVGRQSWLFFGRDGDRETADVGHSLIIS